MTEYTQAPPQVKVPASPEMAAVERRMSELERLMTSRFASRSKEWDPASSPFRATILEEIVPLYNSSNPCVEANLGLLRNGWHSDCTVKCGSYEWKTHKNIICTHNKYFNTLFDGHFEEAQTGVVTLDDKPFAVESLLVYLYTFRIPTMNDITIQDKPTSFWEFQVESFRIADKREAYHMRHNFLAAMINDIRLPNPDVWPSNMESFISSIPFLWEIPSTDGDVIREASKKLMIAKSQDVIGLDSFKQLLASDPNFAVEFFEAMALKIKEQESELQNRDFKFNSVPYSSKPLGSKMTDLPSFGSSLATYATSRSFSPGSNMSRASTGRSASPNNPSGQAVFEGMFGSAPPRSMP
ncbi:MAG: hypothetical protein Q9227_002091 [Pyrenula ochraceoflavens]